MTISRRAVWAFLLGAGVSGTAVASDAAQRGEPRVLSGPDLGFRVHGLAQDGVPIGTLVVRVDGKWVSPQFQSGMRRVS